MQIRMKLMLINFSRYVNVGWGGQINCFGYANEGGGAIDNL